MTTAYTVSALHKVTGLDRRKLGDLLANVVPHETANGRKRYTVRQLIAALLHGGADLNSARIRLTLAQGTKAELEVEVLRGNLISQGEAIMRYGRLVSNARQLFLGMAYRVTAEFGSATGAAVDTLVRENLEALSVRDE